MAKFKAARAKKATPPRGSGWGCIILILVAFILLFVLFYFMLQSPVTTK